jgi:hypothetical protein
LAITSFANRTIGRFFFGQQSKNWNRRASSSGSYSIEAMNELHASAEFELAQLVEKDAGLIETVVTKRVAAIKTELADLQTQAERLGGRSGS